MTSIPFGELLVGMTGFEPATSCSQSRRATNCATSRLFSCFEFNYRCGAALSALLAVPKILFSRCSKNFDRYAKIALAYSDTVGARAPCPKQARPLALTV